MVPSTSQLIVICSFRLSWYKTRQLMLTNKHRLIYVAPKKSYGQGDKYGEIPLTSKTAYAVLLEDTEDNHSFSITKPGRTPYNITCSSTNWYELFGGKYF